MSSQADVDLFKDIMKVMEDEISSIKDFDTLLERSLFETRKFTQADAGSVMLLGDDVLKFSYVQNDTLFKDDTKGDKYAYAGKTINLDDSSIAGYVAINGKSVNVIDAYELGDDVPYNFNRSFDEKNNYRTQSILVIPLKIGRGKVIGVMQLINCQEAGKAVPFDNKKVVMAEMFAAEVSMAIERAKMTRDVIMRMIKMAELRDPKETGAHVNRVGAYSIEIYERWAKKRGYEEGDVKPYKDNLRIAAMLHDVGKVAVSDTILKKPAKLSDDEFNVMKWHTVWGARLFKDANSEVDLMAAEISLNHHEKWDGTGYPGCIEDIFQKDTKIQKGKKEEEIPISARIVSLADVYDALMSKRCYKSAWDENEVLDYIKNQSGKHFDPEVVEAFFEIYDIIRQIQNMYPDEE